jgi:hypothetical protein
LKLLHITTKENIDSILKDGLRCKLKRIIWEDTDGSVIEDREAPASEVPPAIYAYPLEEDEGARYNCWIDVDEDSDAPVVPEDTCGIIFEPKFGWLCIGAWAFGSDFITRKKPILWHEFMEEAKAVSSLAGKVLGLSTPNFYDAINDYDLFTKENYQKLTSGCTISGPLNDLFRIQLSQMNMIYEPGFEVCVMDDIPPDQITAWVDLAGITCDHAWYDKKMTNKRIHRALNNR